MLKVSGDKKIRYGMNPCAVDTVKTISFNYTINLYWGLNGTRTFNGTCIQKLHDLCSTNDVTVQSMLLSLVVYGEKLGYTLGRLPVDRREKTYETC